MIIRMILEAGDTGGIPLKQRIQRIFPDDLDASEYGAMIRLKEMITDAELAFGKPRSRRTKVQLVDAESI